MKNNLDHDGARSFTPLRVPVRFEFTHPATTTVCFAE